jgi:pimeloyl-ACP methyl ester carboxylesterase
LRSRYLIFLIAIVAAGCASQPSTPEAPPPPPAPATASELAGSGLAVVDEADLVLRDAARNKDLRVHVSYPRGSGPVPVIVFSHGAGGSGRTYFPLARFWATHGYAVLLPTHADSLALRGGEPTLAVLRETLSGVATDAKAWENRIRDLVLILDSREAIAERAVGLQGRLDFSRLGVGGHSYGAFTAQLLAGALIDIPKGPKGKSFADARPKAFLLLSAQGKGQQGFNEKSWQPLDRPLLVMTGSRDLGRAGQTPQWRLDPYRYAPPGDKFAVFVEGAAHMSFTGRLAEPGAFLPAAGGRRANPDEEVAIFKQVKIASLAFWDAYLKGDLPAKLFLQSDALASESGGKVKLERK